MKKADFCSQFDWFFLMIYWGRTDVDDVTIHNVLLLYYVKQIDAMFVNRIREMVSFEPVESLWLSGRASEHGIRMSEVRFPMGTQNLFFVPRS